MEVRGGAGPVPQESQLRSGQLPYILSLAIPCQGGGSSRSHLGAWRGSNPGPLPSLRPAAIGGAGAWLPHLQGDAVCEDAG